MNGRGIDFAREIRSADPRAAIFLEADAGRWPPAGGAGDAPGVVRRSMEGQLADLKRGALDRLNGAPTVLGEFGIPFDLNGGRA